MPGTMHISAEKFYGENDPGKRRHHFITPPPANKFKAKKHLSHSAADFRRKISNDYSRISRDDLLGYKRRGNFFKEFTVPSPPKSDSEPDNQPDIRNFLVARKSTKSNDVNQPEPVSPIPIIERPPITTTIEECIENSTNESIENKVPEDSFLKMFDDTKGDDIELLSYSDLLENYATSPDQHIPHGLKNLGNTCYLNSVIQTIFSFNFFIEELIETYNILKNNNTDSDVSIETKLPITNSLLELHAHYKQTTSTTAMIDCLTEFKACFAERISIFESSEEQDAAEFFSYILQTLKQEIEANTPQESSFIRNPIDRYFEYELINETVCLGCKTSKRSYVEKSTTIHLQLTNERTLQSSFTKYLENEQSQLQCTECETFCTVEKSFVGLPKILFFQIIRYSDDRFKDNDDLFAPHVIYLPKRYIKPENMLSPLSTPYKLSLKRAFTQINGEKRPFVKCLNFGNETEAPVEKVQTTEPPIDESVDVVEEPIPCSSNSFDKSDCEKYQLLSVICHIGSTLASGHFTSYVYNFDNSKWFYCNDTQVTEVSFDEVKRHCRDTGYCYYYVHSTT